MLRSSSLRAAMALMICAMLAVMGGASHAQATSEALRAVPYPGEIQLAVDASDVVHHIVRVQQAMPVRAGRLKLSFPRFLPGTHGPYGSIERMTGLIIRQADAMGTTVPWLRDPVDSFSFHVDVPEATSRVVLEFQYLIASKSGVTDGLMTRDFLNLTWSQTLMVPAGYHVGAIPVAASLKLPPDWKYATALRTAGRERDVLKFQPVSLETLVDSPVFAAAHMVRHELDAPGTVGAAALNIFATSESDLKSDDKQIDAHRKLVTQAARLFGSRHFAHYDFLLALLDDVGFDGLEHHQSSENIVNTKYFKDWDKSMGARELLPHEFAHSWNGKFRRPADLLTPDFNTPMQNSLLWLYEGQTEYWGWILSVRSGLTTPDQLRDSLANTIAELSAAPGRSWRNLQDTTNQGTIRGRTLDQDWRSWQRGEDYYHEAALIWLEADMLIREKTGGARSLDDFASSFFGTEDGRITPLPYTFDDVVAALNAVAAHDWRRFLRERIEGKGQDHLSAGVQRAGWKLAWADKPSTFEAVSSEWRGENFDYSLGLRVGRRGNTIRNLLWDGPAFKAGVPRGGEILAVNGMVYNAERLRDALTANKDGKAPVQLIIKDGERVRSFSLDQRQGPRHPRLERVEGVPDLLDAALFQPK